MYKDVLISIQFQISNSSLTFHRRFLFFFFFGCFFFGCFFFFFFFGCFFFGCFFFGCFFFGCFFFGCFFVEPPCFFCFNLVRTASKGILYTTCSYLFLLHTYYNTIALHNLHVLITLLYCTSLTQRDDASIQKNIYQFGIYRNKCPNRTLLLEQQQSTPAH